MSSRARRSPGRRGFGAVLLDLDGCLIDSNDVHARAWQRALERFGHRVGFRRLRMQIGKGGSELLRDFLAPAEHHFLAEAMGRVETGLYLERFDRGVRPFPGAAAAVRAMRRAGLPVVIASSADRGALERALRRLRLSEAIDGFTCADDVRKAKPFDDVFSLAIRRFRLGSRRPVAIGDTPYDVAAAHQIGLPCLGLLSGGFPRKSLAGAEGVFDDLADLWRAGRERFA
jgi:beta-phosphoglucomutase-like phosphatase (HAD superfamily)